MEKTLPVLFLVFAVLLSGCITQIVDSSYSNALGDGAATVTSGKFPEFSPQYVCPDGSIVEDAGDCPPQQGSETGNGNPVEPEPVQIEQCGSVPIEVLVTGMLTPDQTSATDCFNNSLADCSPSSFALSGSFGGKFTIKGSQAEGCLISYYDDTDESTIECFFPMVYLENVSESASQSKTTYISVTLIGINLKNQELEDPASGQKVPLTCNTS